MVLCMKTSNIQDSFIFSGRIDGCLCCKQDKKTRNEIIIPGFFRVIV